MLHDTVQYRTVQASSSCSCVTFYAPLTPPPPPCCLSPSFPSPDHKPTNMVYHPDLGWVLIDAEGAVLLGPDGRVPGRGCHTDFYGAPEQMRQEDPYRSRESDVWAVGRTAKALVLLVEEACRAAAEQQHEGDWVAVVHEGMGQALGKLQSLEAMCCAQEPSKRATLEKAREMLGV